MGRPSGPHESRVEILATVAVLAGYTAPSQIAADLTPDVVRLDLRYRRLFVADAKETETPGTRHTQERLRAYVIAAKAWLSARYSVRLAVCHGDYGAAGPWLSLLRTTARDAAVESTEGSWTTLDRENVLCWVDLSVRPQVDASTDVRAAVPIRRRRAVPPGSFG
ncbi:hypothetical protein GCM10027452_05900 [Micromonospora halotolerans]